MPSFGAPFSGLANERKLTNEELVSSMWLPSDAAATRLSWTAPIIATNRKSIGDYFAHRFVSFQIQSTPSEDDNRNRLV